MIQKESTDSSTLLPVIHHYFSILDFRVIFFVLEQFCQICIPYVVFHCCVSQHILHSVIVHHAQITTAQCFGHRLGNFCFRFHNFCFHVFYFCSHFLFFCNGCCTAFFRLCLCNLFICFCLLDLQMCTDISADVYVRDIDRQNFKCCTIIQPFCQNCSGDQIRIFQN